MSRSARPAGAIGTAETAELRKAGADRPQSKARRGSAAGRGKGRNCGITAEELRKVSLLSSLSASYLIPAPDSPDNLALVLVQSLPPEKPRAEFPQRPPAASGVLVVAEPEPGGEAAAGCKVLKHPAFDRPAVHNERRPGRKRGAVSLAAERRRQAQAAEVQRQARRSGAAHDVRAELAGGADAELIGAALAALDATLRRPGVVFNTPQRAREFLALHLAPRDREAFAVLFLDGQHALIEFAVLFEGTLTHSPVYPREVVRRALKVNAGAVILAHNHPSGNPEPSVADEFLTHALKAALAMVEIRLLDHYIVGRLIVLSMAERGLM